MLLWDTQKHSTVSEKPAVIGVKARAITSGETTQKSIILPPVHNFKKVLVAPVNVMFSYFFREFWRMKITIFHDVQQNLQKGHKNYKKL